MSNIKKYRVVGTHSRFGDQPVRVTIRATSVDDARTEAYSRGMKEISKIFEIQPPANGKANGGASPQPSPQPVVATGSQAAPAPPLPPTPKIELGAPPPPPHQQPQELLVFGSIPGYPITHLFAVIYAVLGFICLLVMTLFIAGEMLSMARLGVVAIALAVGLGIAALYFLASECLRLARDVAVNTWHIRRQIEAKNQR